MAALVAWIGIVRDISRDQTATATALGWRPALAPGELARAGARAAPDSPGMADSGPPTAASPVPRGHPRLSPWPTARLFRLHRLQYLEPPSPYLEPPAPYAVPPSPYPGSPYRVPLRWAPDRLIPGPGPKLRGGPSGSGAWWERSASSAMGVWALVLAILPLFITWLVSIGLAVTVLLRPDDGWRRGRGPAIAALAISAAWILVLTGMVIIGSDPA